MQRLSKEGFVDPGDNFSLNETLFGQVVPGYVFLDPEQEQYLDLGAEKTYGRWLFRSLASKAQAHASHV